MTHSANSHLDAFMKRVKRRNPGEPEFHQTSQCVEKAHMDDGDIDYFNGANIVGFDKVANAILAYRAI